jgi:hypothetical protein
MSKELVNLVEAYETKFSNRKVAHAEIGKKIRSLIEEKKLDVDRISFKGLWEQTVEKRDLSENLTSSAFPVIAGEIISKVMIDAYTVFPKVGDSLVRTVPSRLKESKIAGWKAIGIIKQVHERESYSQVTPPDEKYVRIANEKFGGLLDLTKEAIFFDQTGELIDRARMLGEEGARFREEKIMNCVTDTLSKSYDLGELYSSGNGNLKTSNPLGTSGWQNVHVSLLEKKDEENKPIWVMGDRPVMVIPANLWPTAEKLVRNERGDLGTANLDVNLARNMFDIIVNPYLASGSTTWWYGGFKRQFRWEEIWPLETYSRVGQDTEDGFNKDVIQQFKVSFYGGCGAADTKYVYENQA